MKLFKIAQDVKQRIFSEKPIDAKFELSEFLRFTSLKLENDHPKLVFNNYIHSFVNDFIKNDKINPNFKITGNFNYFLNFNDTWIPHNITKRFQKKTTIRFESSSLLHLACTLGNTYLIETLVEKGADKNYLDANKHLATDFLRFNPNYMEREEFIRLKGLLEPNVLSKTHRLI